MNYNAFGLVISCDIDLSDRLELTHAKSDIVISKSAFKLPSMSESNVYRRGEQASFGEDSAAMYLKWAAYGEFRISNGDLIEYQAVNQETFQMFVLSEVIGILCWQRGYFLLHAGAVAINGKAHVFTGTPGMGKSTTITALWQAGAHVLSDDLVVIKDYKACLQSLNELKIWEKTVEGLEINRALLRQSQEGIKKYLLPTKSPIKTAYPLAAIRFISEQENPILPAVEMLKYFPLPHQILQKEAIKKHFEDAVNISKNCEMKHLKRFTDFTTLKTWAQDYIRNAK